jgi:prepilin-type N-terminal cleavage/methylation domain-containing protein
VYNADLNQKGFSLIELMIAMFIFMIVMLGMLAGVNSSIQTNKGNVLRDEAIRLAEDELSRLRSEQFTSMGVSANLADTNSKWTGPNNITVNVRSGQITYALFRRITDIASGISPLKRIDVAVGWNDVGGATAPQEPTNMNSQVILSTILVQASN